MCRFGAFYCVHWKAWKVFSILLGFLGWDNFGTGDATVDDSAPCSMSVAEDQAQSGLQGWCLQTTELVMRKGIVVVIWARVVRHSCVVRLFVGGALHHAPIRNRIFIVPAWWATGWSTEHIKSFFLLSTLVHSFSFFGPFIMRQTHRTCCRTGLYRGLLHYESQSPGYKVVRLLMHRLKAFFILQSRPTGMRSGSFINSLLPL